ncbi:uncharacterized protein V1516DRAFT_671289 [Lipomyces oligophaga]|uniref:uncharacterized protein n=1 Tax=Lipomyces oligophaga TaxID=45792 RepID=UPI0034CF2D15
MSFISGTYQASHLQAVEYGPGSIRRLPQILAQLHVRRPFIITGTSIRTSTPIISDIIELLSLSDTVENTKQEIGVFGHIRQHAPIEDINAALVMFDRANADSLIVVGGGSPIDSAKLISVKSERVQFPPIIAIPTTLSVAETTSGIGYTSESGHKAKMTEPRAAPKYIIYDSELLKYTPKWLLLSTGMRAVDHAIETIYHKTVGELPFKPLALAAAGELFTCLPKLAANPDNTEYGQRAMNAVFMSLFPRERIDGPLGLSHSIGLAIGSSYTIPHGITSCITLPHTVRYKIKSDTYAEKQIKRLVPFLGLPSNSPAEAVADAISELIASLNLTATLSDYRAPREDARRIAIYALHNEADPELDAIIHLIELLY